ncbi:MAG: M24 family metallopeptidase [Anaerolineales bacterium]
MEELFLSRQRQMQSLLQDTIYDLIVFNPSPTLFYLTGLSFHLMERPIIFLFPKTTDPIIFLPELELAKIGHLNFHLNVVTYGENPATWNSEFAKTLNYLNKKENLIIGIEASHLRFLEFQFLQSNFPSLELKPADDLIAEIRLRKDDIEKEYIKQAIQIAEIGLENTLPFIKPGITEREIASELVIQLISHGSDPQLPFFPIVASGENSANPHAEPSHRKIQSGDVLVIDWGARYHGYISDLTRTFVIGKSNPEINQVYNVVKKANEIGCQFVKPEIQCGEVDTIVRDYITQQGFGDYFTHRTGHGIGLETHEEPYIRSDNSNVLKPRMTFTIEPGVYLPNKFGVRIEDNVYVTENNSEILSKFPRELTIL